MGRFHIYTPITPNTPLWGDFCTHVIQQIQVEHTVILTKNTILFGFYIFMHRHPAPSAPESVLYTYLQGLMRVKFPTQCSCR